VNSIKCEEGLAKEIKYFLPPLYTEDQKNDDIASEVQAEGMKDCASRGANAKAASSVMGFNNRTFFESENYPEKHQGAWDGTRMRIFKKKTKLSNQAIKDDSVSEQKIEN